jgi:subtilisin family serine protease
MPFLFLCAAIQAFSQRIDLLSGINYGGPLPAHSTDSTSGHPIPGLHSGLSFEIKISEKFSIQPEIYYSFKGVDYSQSYTKDTTVEIVINGVTGTVPSFYSAFVNGSMRLHNIDLPLLVKYKFRKTGLLAGVYCASLIKGKDVGDVRVVIGEGGFYDDYTEIYNNIKLIRKFDFGIVLGTCFPLYKKLSFEIKASRSMLSLYKPGSLENRGNGSIKLYNTFGHFSFLYTFCSK